jgi:hypothetical protein
MVKDSSSQQQQPDSGDLVIPEGHRLTKTGKIRKQPAEKTSLIEIDNRVKILAKMISHGQRRSDCILYGRDKWGVCDSVIADYLRLARAQLKADWDIERPQMLADLLSQLATIQQEARKAGHLHIALGAVNTAAKLAQLCS